MPYRKIIDKPSVNLFRQQSPVTCWVASAYMLYNWKNNSNLSYDQFVMRNLPKGIYGYYLLEEKLRTSANPFDEEVFNLAFRDLDLLWDTLYITDTPQSRQARIALEHDYYHDYENHLLNNETLARLNQTSGVGLPYIHAAYFLSAHANNFKPLGQNKLYSAKEWFAMLNHYGPLLVSVCRTSDAGIRFGHFIIVDGFWGSPPFNDNSSCQIYAQDPKFGTIRGQYFPQFQDDCKDALSKVGAFNYIWHANKIRIADLSIEQCVRKLDLELPGLLVK